MENVSFDPTYGGRKIFTVSKSIQPDELLFVGYSQEQEYLAWTGQKKLAQFIVELISLFCYDPSCISP